MIKQMFFFLNVVFLISRRYFRLFFFLPKPEVYLRKWFFFLSFQFILNSASCKIKDPKELPAKTYGKIKIYN